MEFKDINKKHRKLFQELVIQWGITAVVGTVFTVSVGISVSALYEILRQEMHWSAMDILALGSVLTIFFADGLLFNIKMLFEKDTLTNFEFLKTYWKSRYHFFRNIFKPNKNNSQTRQISL